DAVRLDGEVLVPLEHLADRVAVDDQHRAEERLVDLAARPDLLEHGIRLQLEEEGDDRANRAPLPERLSFELLEFLRVFLAHLPRASLAGQFEQAWCGHGVVANDAFGCAKERLQRSRCIAQATEIRRHLVWHRRRRARNWWQGREGLGFGSVLDRESHAEFVVLVR